MSDTPRDISPLDTLALAAADGSLDAAGWAQLNAMLTAEPAARERYVHLLLLTDALRHHRAAVNAELGTGNSQRPAVAKPGPSAAELRGRSTFSSHRWATYGLAAALFLAAVAVAIYVLASNSKPETQDSKLSAGPLAMILDTSGGGTLVVDDRIANPGDEVGVGDLVLDTGTADVRLANGVNFRVTGGTHLSVRDPMYARLTRGTVDFDVPPAAVGFAVELPDRSRIVDLGTAFRVVVDDSGSTRLRVTEGAVEWRPASPAAQPVRVAAGQSARIADGAPVIISTPPFEEGFESPAIASAADSERVVPAGWIATTRIAGYGWDRGGIVREGTADFSTPHGEQGYMLAYANAALTTAPATIEHTLAANVTYTLAFDAIGIGPDSAATYLVELVGFSEGDDRQDDESGIVLAHATGRVSPNGDPTSDRVVFTPNPDDPNLGAAIAIRLKGLTGRSDQTRNGVVYDHITLTVEPADAQTESTTRPSEPADRSGGDRAADGPSSEK